MSLDDFLADPAQPVHKERASGGPEARSNETTHEESRNSTAGCTHYIRAFEDCALQPLRGFAFDVAAC